MNEEKTDQQIIQELQEDINVEENLNHLVDRHSGIYLDMVNAFASPNNQFIDHKELVDDKYYKIYNTAIKFDETKGAKFSTYLGNETKWMCLNIYNKNKRKPLFSSEFIENMAGEEDASCDTISESIKEDMFNKVLSIIKKHPDKRVEKIFTMRYITGNKNKVMPWRSIGSKVNLSIQGCINVHNSAVKHIQEKLVGELNFE